MLNKGKEKNITNFFSPCHHPHTERTRARASEDLLKQIYYVRHQAFSALKHFHVVLVASLDERLFIEFFFLHLTLTSFRLVVVVIVIL